MTAFSPGDKKQILQQLVKTYLDSVQSSRSSFSKMCSQCFVKIGRMILKYEYSPEQLDKFNDLFKQF